MAFRPSAGRQAEQQVDTWECMWLCAHTLTLLKYCRDGECVHLLKQIRWANDIWTVRIYIRDYWSVLKVSCWLIRRLNPIKAMADTLCLTCAHKEVESLDASCLPYPDTDGNVKIFKKWTVTSYCFKRLCYDLSMKQAFSFFSSEHTTLLHNSAWKL